MATSARFGPVVEADGYPAEAAGLDWLEGDYESIPVELRAPDGMNLAQFFAHQFVWMTAERLARDVVRLADRWRPDLIVRETTEFGGALAGELLGVPVAALQVASPSLITPALLVEVERALNDVRASLDLPPDTGLRGLLDQPVICFAPPALHDPEVPLPPRLFSFRPPPPPSAVPLPGVDDLGRERPLVYATLGTAFSDPAFDLPFFPAVLEGLREQPVDLVVTVGPVRDPASLGEQPSNVLVRSYVPQRGLLERCAVVVCHGGYGTLLDAIDAGTPLVVVPFGADQPINARSVERLGIGRVLDDDLLTAEAVREAVADLLTDPTWRHNIERVRDEWRRLPGADAAVRLLDEVAATSAHAIGHEA